jgi:hypothetical protein
MVLAMISGAWWVGLMMIEEHFTLRTKVRRISESA